MYTLNKILEYVSVSEIVAWVVLFIACLVTAFLIVKDVLKEVLHPTKSSTNVDDVDLE